ncbi:hypothetical protein Q1695_003400 [Nippostrongylus brasiliensis]|nr:hypothetical protein Q1695_003400 [Nippostrongylus brasiliensis]
MFRSAFSRIAAGAVGVQMCAAGVALSDKELSKKPDWYQKDVLALEASIKKLGRHGFNTSPLAINESFETLKRYQDIENVEVHWRMARALVEKSFFSKCPKEKAHLLHEAKSHAKKAIHLEGEDVCAGAHKWYAFALAKLEDLDNKADHSAEIIKHLEKAAKADKEDAYTVHMLGVAHYKKKNYEEALNHFHKAESIRKNFSSCNLFYTGLAYQGLKKKEEAIKSFCAAYRNHAHNEHEVKARTLAKAMLLKLKVKKEDYEEEEY